MYRKWMQQEKKKERSKIPGSKKINIVVIVSSSGGRSSSATKSESGACFWELFHSGAKRLDVVVPEVKHFNWHNIVDNQSATLNSFRSIYYLLTSEGHEHPWVQLLEPHTPVCRPGLAQT